MAADDAKVDYCAEESWKVCGLLSIPWSELSEADRSLRRTMVRTVLAAADDWDSRRPGQLQ